ncbi:MAG: nitroreductase family protein [Desulfatibacillum sp.]|nr:nitroreductase family protein [Desulfatibacillum sp.]
MIEIRRLEDKCNQCMLCVRECVSGVFRDVDGIPTVVDPRACNLCSHCVAICPKNAIEHSGLDLGQVRRVDNKIQDPEVFAEIVRTRRSVRAYKDKPVPREVLEQIIGLAKYSPTASNTQHVEYVVVTDRDLIKRVADRIFSYGERFADWTHTKKGKLVFGAVNAIAPKANLGRYVEGMDHYKEDVAKGKDIILHNAPALVLIHAPAKAPFACDNCNIAAANITSYAHALGLGTCYIGFLTLTLRLNKGMRRELGIPKGNKAFVSLVMGYPAYKFKRITARKEPSVTWIGAA